MVAFAAALIMSLNELNLKLWGNTEFMCETYTVAKTFGQLMFSWVTNNFKLPYTHHVLAKLKQESRFLSLYKFTASTFLRLKLQFQQHFSDAIDASGKEISSFQNHLTVQLRSFHLTVNWKWLIWSVLTY